MSVDRLKRVNELLRREIGEALFRVMTEADVDISTVMVTRVIASRNLRHARVMVSVRGQDDERQRTLSRLKRHRSEIQRLINRDLVLKYTPKLLFELDTSVERGNHMLDILNELAAEGGFDEPEPEEPPSD
jgi:ribosome-binding factor A